MSIQRRTFLRGTLAGSAVGVAVGAGLLAPRAVLAAWPKAAFEAKAVDEALKQAYGTASLTDSAKVEVKAPDIAENGAVVPVTVEAGIDKVSTLSVIAEKNPAPLVAKYELAAGTQPYVSMRIKMGKTGNVVAVAESGGTLYRGAKEVKVTIGGCGG